MTEWTTRKFGESQLLLVISFLVLGTLAQVPAEIAPQPSPWVDIIPQPIEPPSKPKDVFVLGQNYSCDYVAVGEMECHLGNGNSFLFTEEEVLEVGSWNWWLYLIVSVVLIILAGLMSGLNIGLLSLDLMNLRILQESGTPEQKKYTSKIIPLCKRHHLLLVTLLLANAACMEALPVLLDQLLPSYAAIIISVTLVLFFGEIIPQAICSRHALAIGYYSSWFIWGLIALLFVLAWPIAKLLDCLLGHETLNYYRTAELKELVKQHARDPESGLGGDTGPLTDDEVRIIHGALDMREKKCDDNVYTPISAVFSLSGDTVLDLPCLQKIHESGHSRIPIYRKKSSHIIGILLVKDLITVSPGSTKVDSLDLVQVPQVTAEIPLFTLLNQFKQGRSHMAVVLDPKDHLTTLGIVTLEDVIEELLESEIYDERDLIRDQEQVMRRLRLSADMGPRHSKIVDRSSHGTPVLPRSSKAQDRVAVGLERNDKGRGFKHIKGASDPKLSEKSEKIEKNEKKEKKKKKKESFSTTASSSVVVTKLDHITGEDSEVVVSESKEDEHS